MCRFFSLFVGLLFFSFLRSIKVNVIDNNNVYKVLFRLWLHAVAICIMICRLLTNQNQSMGRNGLYANDANARALNDRRLMRIHLAVSIFGCRFCTVFICFFSLFVIQYHCYRVLRWSVCGACTSAPSGMGTRIMNQ